MSFEHTNLDFYDDGGALLKETFSSRASLPDFIKSAAVLGDDAAANQYALVLIEDGRSLKKFATADAGNTFISAVYFAKNRHALPIEAQKVAAANLREAMLHFQIDVPGSLQKIAGSPWVPSSNIVWLCSSAVCAFASARSRTASKFSTAISRLLSIWMR